MRPVYFSEATHRSPKSAGHPADRGESEAAGLVARRDCYRIAVVIKLADKL